MRTLILSCNTGEGHNACAKAIKEVYDINGQHCVIEDALCFIQSGVSKVTSDGHVFLYRHLPQLFNWGYAFAEKHPSTFNERSVVYNFISLGAKKLARYITEENYDTVISTHPFASIMLTEARSRHNIDIKTAFVATDYTCCPSVKDSKLDYYFVPDKGLVCEFICDHIPEERIIPSGLPVKQTFFSSIDKKEAKRKIGIDPENKHVVMMSGSMGCGPIEELAEYISEGLKPGCEFTVICGTNKHLKRDLDVKLGDRPNVHVQGFVTDISTMLDSADVYLTKPGGISTTEASIKKLPMLFIDAVAACETYNLLWFTNAGVATMGQDERELADVCLRLLDDDSQMNEMRAAYEKLDRTNGARIIYDKMTSL